MVIFKNVIFVIICIVSIFLLLALTVVINSIAMYFDAKKQDITINSNRLKSANLLNKCEATASLLKVIDVVIDLEITEVIRTYTTLGTSYNINNTTNDINNISKTVYESIKKEVFLNDDSILTDKYLMSYITNVVTMNFITKVRNMNLIIYEEK